MKTHMRKLRILSFMFLSVFLLSSCAETQLVSHWVKNVSWPGQKESKGTYKVGNPYKVENVWYYPEENFKLKETGIASWYGPNFHANNTANGEVFDQHELTAAHRTLQMPSLVRVTNLENGRSVVVRVNDRGPFKRGRIMDLSKRAAQLLGFINKGTARVRIKVLEKESMILAAAAQRGEDTTRMTLADINGHMINRDQVEKVEASATTAKPKRQLTSRRISKEKEVVAVKNIPPVVEDITPESLRTPTITVEALNMDGDTETSLDDDTLEEISYNTPASRKLAVSKKGEPVAKLTPGKIKSGRFMPSHDVSKEAVQPTGLFVQAGSFRVYANAESLAKDMVGIAPTIIEPVMVKSGKMYRVKLGPISSLADADNVLSRVIQAGQATAMLVKNKK